jgi:hypothetical protein
MSELGFPFDFDARGLSSGAAPDEHVRQLIEQVLLTAPGERVMRPDFGSGLQSLVFEPNGSVLAAATQMLVQSALHQHLGHLIAVDDVSIEQSESLLRVSVRYILLRDQDTRTAVVTLGAGA